MKQAVTTESQRTKTVVRLIERLRNIGGLRGTDIANFAGVSKTTVSHWLNGEKSPHPRTQLIVSDLSYIVLRLSEYNSREQVRVWLYTPHPQLNGERVVDLIHSERSEEVIAVPGRLDADAYL